MTLRLLKLFSTPVGREQDFFFSDRANTRSEEIKQKKK
jgi:hypothetical protein